MNEVSRHRAVSLAYIFHSSSVNNGSNVLDIQKHSTDKVKPVFGSTLQGNISNKKMGIKIIWQ